VKSNEKHRRAVAVLLVGPEGVQWRQVA